MKKAMAVSTNKPIAVLGAGAWGTALALYLARRKQSVCMWTIEADHAIEMDNEKTNRRYLKGYPFPEDLKTTGDIGLAVKNMQDILIAVPSAGFRQTLELLKPHITAEHRIVCATKGIDDKSGELLHQAVIDVLGKGCVYAVISGPSFAAEVAKGLPTAVVIASKQPSFGKDCYERFNSSIFRIFLSDDIIGVEVGAVIKNVVAIATGISDGMSYGTNARCALITYGLNEMRQLGTALGAQQETFTGLSGLGDLVLTCSDDQSRNRRFGLALGRGEESASAEKSIAHVVEGKRNVELVMSLAEKHHIKMPICEMVWKTIAKKQSPQEAMDNLLTSSTLQS